MSRLRVPAITPGDRKPVVCSTLPDQLNGTLWAMASGSGGVGRSTLAATLARRLVFRGQKVCLVDADWTGPTLSSLLDLPASGGSDWTGQKLDPERAPHHEDLRLVQGVSPVAGDPSRQDALGLLVRVRQLPDDQVVLDLPAGAHDAALDLWLSADYPVLVTVPERVPLEATGRLLARVFARRVSPWLAEKIGPQETAHLLSEAWEDCAGRTGAWMRSVAQATGVTVEALADQAGGKSIYLVLNRVRRGDDIDVGHALVTAAGHGLGLDLRFRAVFPYEPDGWIRSRRTRGILPEGADLFGSEVDGFVERMAQQMEVPSLGDWKSGLREAAQAAGV